jgi:hypothetical protein
MDKPLSLAAKLLLIGAGGLAVVAGPVLFLFPGDTAAYFAWTIKHPLTPVFMGANYFGGIGAIWAMRTNRWSVARVLLPGVFVFAITQLAATVLNLPIFNWQHPVAWAWLFVYVSSPLGVLFVYWQMQRGAAPGTAVDAPAPLPGLRQFMLVFAALNGAIGVALWLSPFVFAGSSAGAAPWWAWTLTPLTAGVVGGWYLAAATLYATMARPHPYEGVRIALFGVMCATGLELLGALLHAEAFNGPALTAGLYLLNAAMIFGFALFTFVKGAPVPSVSRVSS